MKEQKHVLVTGAKGLIGKHLTRALLAKGFRVSHLSRTAGDDKDVQTYLWDVDADKIDEKCINGVDVILHLAGAGIADKKWTAARKKELTESRTKSVGMICDLIKNKPNKVNAIISAAAIGYYGDRGGDLMTEDCPPGEGFLPECCVAWENAVDEGKALGMRVVKFRTGVVLDKEDGALPQMARPVNLFAGAPLGNGKQWIPWIHIQDVVDMYLYAIENEKLQGVFNMAAPLPVTNKQLMQAIAKQLHKPLWPINVPPFVFKLLMGEMSTIILGSTKVSPQKIEEAGFRFKYPELQGALKNIYE